MRCFVAIWPAPSVAAGLAALPRPPLPGLRWTGPGQWHVTLRFFGEMSPPEVAGATAALDRVANEHDAPATVTGGPRCRLLGPGLVVWPVSGLDGLAADVGRATAHLGQAPPGRPFYGHITLGRARQGVDLRQRDGLLAPMAAEWQARAICLVESQLHPEGARYRNIVEIALGPPSS